MDGLDFKYLRHLATFALVVNEKSFAGAARKLEISRSRVSETVSVLEEHLAARLINRTTRQLSLTHEGRRVYEYAKQLPSIVSEVAEALSQESIGGKITLTSTHDIAVKILSPCLAEFEKQYPDIQIELMLSDLPLDLIEDEVDLAFRVGVPKDSSYIGRTLHVESLKLYASPEYLREYGEPSTLQELEKLNWVCLKQLLSGNAVELQNDKQLSLIYPTHFHVCDSPIMMQKMLSDGMGVGLLLPSTVKDEQSANKLVPIMEELSGPSLSFALYYPSRRHLPARTRRFVDFIIEANLFA